MFKILENNSLLEAINFPDNESFVKFDYDGKPLTIVWHYESDAEIMVLAQIYDIISDKDPTHRMPKNLFIPYLPHARQDRRTSSNQPFSLNILMSFIGKITSNSNTEIYALDIHNPNCVAIQYNNIKNIKSSNYAELVYNKNAYDAIIIPDKGAYDRCDEWWKIIYADTEEPKLIQCHKNRDPNTGQLSNPVVELSGEQYLKQKNNSCLIVDDIGTGFGTHIQLAKVIKEHNPDTNLDIWVTHASFTRGIDVVLEHFNHVYTTDSLISGRKYHSNPRITAFDSTQFLPKLL
jgi:ribose-phosphate pyrophosphokinase